jgi:hypothetical protein
LLVRHGEGASVEHGRRPAVTDRLPELDELVDCKALMRELGVTRSVAEKVMRALPIVRFPDVRKVFVRRSDVAAYVERYTFTNDDAQVLS